MATDCKVTDGATATTAQDLIAASYVMTYELHVESKII